MTGTSSRPPLRRPGSAVPTRRRRRARRRTTPDRAKLAIVALALLATGSGGTWLGLERAGGRVPALADAERPELAAPAAPAAPAGDAGGTGTAGEPGTVSRTGTAGEPPEAAGPITLAFAGDIHAEGPSGAALAAGLPSVRDLLSQADLTVVNLEAAVTERGTPAPKQFVFRAPASTFGALREAGVDVVSMANNHGLDYGVEGVTDALAASRAAGLPVVGLGEDEDEAYAPHVAVVRGHRVAVLGATQVLDSSLAQAWTAGPDSPGMASAKRVERLLDEVRAAREVAHTVVVYLHWGQERDACPLPRQEELAEALAEAGADVVVGTHAHVLLGGGVLGGTYVDYGLGNFVFSGSRRPEAARSGVLVLTVTGDEVTGAAWEPAEVRSGVPVLLEGEQARRAREDKDSRRGCTGLASLDGQDDADAEPADQASDPG